MPIFHVTIHERPNGQDHDLFIRAADADGALLQAMREVRAAVGDGPDLLPYRVDRPRRRRTDLQVGAQP